MMALISLWIAGLLIKNVCCYLQVTFSIYLSVGYPNLDVISKNAPIVS